MENCTFLEGKVDEVALLLFETETSLARVRHDFPLELTSLDLRFHAHLPLDLPWERGGAVVAEICLELLDKIDFLNLTGAVLHSPPVQSGKGGIGSCLEAITAFAETWRAAGRRTMDVLLENTHENDLTCLEKFFLPQEGTEGFSNTFGLCPDLGHILAYGQESFRQLLQALPDCARPRMLHCSAPGAKIAGSGLTGSHQPLDFLDTDGLVLGKALCSCLAPGAVIVAELFDWRYFQRSLPIIHSWLDVTHPGA